MLFRSLSIIMDLRPVIFRYTDEYLKEHPSITDRFYYNYIAQEYQEVFPNEVFETNDKLEGMDSNILQIDTHAPNIVAIKAIQELKLKLDEKDQEISELRAEKDIEMTEKDQEISELRKDVEEKDREISELRSYLCSKDSDASFCE